MAKKTDKECREMAKIKYEKEGEIEIDDKAPVSRAKGNPDKGAYVQAWVWVYDDDSY